MRRPSNLTAGTSAPRALPAPVQGEAPGAPANYLDLYGLSKAPFGSAHDGTGFILFSSHRRAFELVIDHMINGAGVLLVQGEEGIGKTETLRAAANVAGESGLETIVVSRLPGERIDLARLVSALGDQSGGGQSGESEAGRQDVIARFLQPPRKALLIDDADLMGEDCVQFLWSIVQRMKDAADGSAIILSISTDLAPDAKRVDLSQLTGVARNTIRMPRLGPAEVRQYIERSLWIAGGTTRRLISTDAMKILIARSNGVPGVVNRLMEAAFTAGFARGDGTIAAKTVAAAVGSLHPKPARKENENSELIERAARWVAAGLFVIGAAVFIYQGLKDRDANPQAGSSSSIQAPIPAPGASIGQAPPAKPSASPTVEQPTAAKSTAAKSTETLAPALIAALIKRGDQSIELGDIAAARLLFQRAADAGNAGAATSLGKTYDPNFMPPGGKANPAKAAEWYQKAMASGDPRAGELLKRLGSR
jgi:type II secretory pathway predicted ATPase ExeA